MRPEKANIVADLSEKLNRSPFLLVTDYQRMKVDQFGELRNRLAPTGAEVHVVKNSFLKRAIAASDLPDIAAQLSGQTAVVTGDQDVAPVAKVLKAFAAEFKIATLKIGVVDKNVLSTAEVESLADLPSREVLLAQFLGLPAGDNGYTRTTLLALIAMRELLKNVDKALLKDDSFAFINASIPRNWEKINALCSPIFSDISLVSSSSLIE